VGDNKNDSQQLTNLQAAIGQIRRLRAEVAEIQKEKADEIAKTAEEETSKSPNPLLNNYGMLKSHQISKYHNSQVSMERAIHWNT
jgi:short-subunit dehydrogenase involved in D-alanine esterification of teichoic acids